MCSYRPIELRLPTAAEQAERLWEQYLNKIASIRDSRAHQVHKLSFSSKNPISLALASAAPLQPLMMDLRYKLLVNRTPIPFITSDHPVILYNQFMERLRKTGSGEGLAAKGLQVFLPLAPDCCLILYDEAVYDVGGRSLADVKFDATLEDIRSLNVLQVANAGNLLFFNGGMSEVELKTALGVGKPFRRNARSTVNAYTTQPNDDGLAPILIHSSKSDLRVGLALSQIRESKSANEYKLGNRVVHVRDPVLCDLHDEFLKMHDQGKYRASQFGRFLRDRQQELTALAVSPNSPEVGS